MVFWTLLFPIVLSTLFFMAFSNLNQDAKFKPVSIAIVNNEAYQKNDSFKNMMDQLSKGDDKTFSVQYVTKEKADTLLKNSKIDAFIELTPKITLSVKSSGFGQSITRVCLDQYNQFTTAIEQIIKQNPAVMQTDFANHISDDQSYIKDVPISKSSPDNTLTYYFALIAMASLYGAFWGLKEVTDIQADMSAQAARVNVTPIHKLKIFLINSLAAWVINIVELLLLLCYMQFVLKINLGQQFGYILLICVVSSFTGISMGAFIAALVKKNEGLKIAVLIGGTMVCSFLAGLMYSNMKYIVATNAPILSYLNPANLVADSFYALYYYDTLTRFYTNIGILAVFAAVFCTVTYFILRRQKYASI